MGCDCEKNREEEKGRRNFLTKLSVGIGAGIAAILAFPLVTAMLDPVMRKRKNLWRPVGKLSEFGEGETKMVKFTNAEPFKWSDKLALSAAYVRRKPNNEFMAFSVNCTHLGCPVRWEEKPQMFFCPCHGGVFYKDGSRAAGPPNRGLFKYAVRVTGETVEVLTEALPIKNMT